jgi:hypothetical protein
LQKQFGYSPNTLGNTKKSGNLKDSAHSNFTQNANKDKNPKISFLEKQNNNNNNENKNLLNDEDKGNLIFFIFYFYFI